MVYREYVHDTLMIDYLRPRFLIDKVVIDKYLEEMGVPHIILKTGWFVENLVSLLNT